MILYTVHYIMYSVQRTVYTAYCTLYTVYYIQSVVITYIEQYFVAKFVLNIMSNKTFRIELK